MRFDEVNLDENVLQGIEAMNFQEMTPVQEQTIPVILEGKDIIGCAQTGTGKTAAYTLPLLSRLVAEGNPDNHIRAVIMVPTRELAQQIDMQFEGFSYFLPISTTVVYGGGDGAGWDQQKKGLLMGADVVIATPGRLLSHIANSGIDLSQVSYFILDEADRMLDMGFFDDIMQIVKQMPTKRQTILFSATLPPKIRQLAKQILKDPAEINIAISKPNEAIIQSAYICYETQKMAIIQELFSKPNRKKTIIFSSSKQKVKDLAYSLKRMKLNVAAMHSDLEQEQVLLSFIKTDNVYHKYYDDVLILLKTGLRISELCGLTVADIDFKNEVVIIDHQLLKSKEQGYYIETPKTKSGIRQVPLSRETIQALQRVMKKRPKTEPFVIDGRGNFLFVNQKGKPKVAIDYNMLFVRIVKKYNKHHKDNPLPHITPHTLRHTFCTRLASKNMNPKDLQYIMGHSNISITMNWYAHASIDTAKSEVQRLIA